MLSGRKALDEFFLSYQVLACLDIMFTFYCYECSSFLLLYGIVAVPSPVCRTVASQDTSLWDTGMIEVLLTYSLSYTCIILVCTNIHLSIFCIYQFYVFGMDLDGISVMLN